MYFHGVILSFLSLIDISSFLRGTRITEYFLFEIKANSACLGKNCQILNREQPAVNNVSAVCAQ